MVDNINAKLFPSPNHQSAVKNHLAPRTWPGVTPASTAAVRVILTDNHKRFHVFFNERGFHNHSAHAALSLWTLGADKSILQASYEASSKYQRPAFASPNPITKQNWVNHLGKEDYYQGYLEFFQSELEHKDFSAILEEYVFATDANFSPGQSADKQPEMLNRFFEGLLHPIIHTGFGLEFGLPGTFAEGLAQTAVHPAGSTGVLPAAFFSQSEDSLVSRFASAVGLGGQADKKVVHAFTVLARVLADPTLALDEPPEELVGFYQKIVAKHGQSIQKYANQWTLEGDLQKKVEELLWTNALIYGVGGNEATGPFNADFFHMHLVTSSLFLSTVFVHLRRSSQILLLKAYFSVSLGWYISRGRPPLDIARFFGDSETLLPIAPGPQPSPNEAAHPSPSSAHAVTPDPWLPIIQSSLTHPDDHLPKLQRALAEYASHFGSTPAGTFAGTELKDAELIDGTLFIRAAGLTQSRVGWVREGQAPLDDVWDRHGFFKA